jgi:hypothetical protein
MNSVTRGALGSVHSAAHDEGSVDDPLDSAHDKTPPRRNGHSAQVGSSDLRRALADVKGQAQFLLYLADQIEESLEQLANEPDACHGAFLCKVLGMYSVQLETKHHGLGDRIAETCQEIYVTVREFDAV